LATAQQLLAAILAAKTFHMIPGADHRFSRPEHFSQMTDLMVNWLIAMYLSPLL
jgi:hypothetical protein